MTTSAPIRGMDDLGADAPASVAARLALKKRLTAVARLLPAAASEGPEAEKSVHDLRVATRRAGAAMRMFEAFVGPRILRRSRKMLRAIRRAAADARRADVQRTLLTTLLSDEGALHLAATILFEDVARSRAEAQVRIDRVAGNFAPAAIRRLRRQVVRSVTIRAHRRAGTAGPGAVAPFTLGALAQDRLGAAIDDLRAGLTARTDDFARLHALRLSGKRLRYALEVFAGCTDATFHERVSARLRQMQDMLGAVNDVHELLLRTEALLAVHDTKAKDGSPAGDGHANGDGVRADGAQDDDSVPMGADAAAALRSVHTRLSAERREQMESFQDWWFGAEVQSDLSRLADTWHAFVGATTARRYGRRRARATDGNGHESAPDTPAASAPHQHWRVAAVDVGTNSIRLVVAESDPATKFRVIEDVRETTRLGAGLYQTGRISPSAMEQSLTVLERMRAIWDGHHIDRIRAVGTSAVREARNGREFIDQVRRRAGLRIEVIDQDYEARLAFSSVTNAFHLEDQRFAAVDLGGGSAELVISSGELIDSIHKLPLGSVRLTDMYGLPGERGDYRFNAMRKAVDDMLDEQVSRPRAAPELMIGTGGTFTTLARVCIRRGMKVHGEGRFSFAVRGYELTHGEVAFMLDWLRSLSLSERRQVPGMGFRRAEIIVAGLCVIERLMEHLHIDRLWIHDGGIRDGLLAEMIDDLTGSAERGPIQSRDVAAKVRPFAERSRFDQPHSDHVAQLALRIFDQLAVLFPEAEGSWAGADGREVLHAAGILHDVGILVGYRRHHRHSYDMIQSADLPAISRRMVALIANVARYHRRGGPKRSHDNVRRLREDDQRLLGHLAGILRIADGLDRSHTQCVRDVVVHGDADEITFRVVADEPPTLELRHARRKADVFEEHFRSTARFRWCGGDASARGRGRRA